MATHRTDYLCPNGIDDKLKWQRIRGLPKVAIARWLPEPRLKQDLASKFFISVIYLKKLIVVPLIEEIKL